MDGVEPVLLAVRLPLHEQHLLGDAVRRVRLLRIAVPQVALEKRHRRQPGIGANRPHADELAHPCQPRPLHRQRAHHHVLIEEPARRLAVRADAADDRGEMHDDVGTGLVEQARDVGFVSQIVLRFPNDDDVTLVAVDFGPGLDLPTTDLEARGLTS